MSEPLYCPGCGATWYSAAAGALLREGQRCLRCDSVLVAYEQAEASGESGRIRTVRAFHDAWMSRDRDFAAQLCHSQLEIQLERAVPPEGRSVFHGRSGIQDLWQALPELRAEAFQVEMCELRELEAGVASQTDLRAAGEGEHHLSGRVTGTWRFEEGKIRSLDILLVCPEALNAANPGEG
jgi:ketosteroid isomerase-like protein